MKDSTSYQNRFPRWVIAIAGATFVMVSGPVHGSITFTPLGDLAGGAFMSQANAVSNNGIVVGRSAGSRGHKGEAFRWTVETGMQDLGDLPGDRYAGRADGISADGTVIVGRSSTQRQALRWTASEGLVPLSDPPSGQYFDSAQGISADGTVIVGSAGYAVRWTETEGPVSLGVLPGGNLSQARAASADGSVVVGYGNSSSGQQAFRWTEATGMAGLGDLPGGITLGEATGVSADGSVVVGYGFSSSAQEAFRWANGQMDGLGMLPGSSYSSALDVSGDGKLIVGRSNGAFLWDETNGMRSLQELVENAIGELTGWTLTTANGISDNGRYIVGYGRNPDSNTEAWLIDLGTTVVPEPLSVVVWGGLTCFAALVVNRRSRG